MRQWYPSISFIVGHRLKLPIKGCSNLESYGNRLQEKGLYIGRTLVSAGWAGLVPVQILNTSNKFTIGAQIAVAVAKPVTSVAELEDPKQTSHSH